MNSETLHLFRAFLIGMKRSGIKILKPILQHLPSFCNSLLYMIECILYPFLDTSFSFIILDVLCVCKLRLRSSIFFLKIITPSPCRYFAFHLYKRLSISKRYMILKINFRVLKHKKPRQIIGVWLGENYGRGGIRLATISNTSSILRVDETENT